MLREDPAAQVARLLTVRGPRPRTALIGVGLVLVLTFVGLFYLSQTLEASAARYQRDTLLVDRASMLRDLKTQQGATLMTGSATRVTQWAQSKDLNPLDGLVRVRAR